MTVELSDLLLDHRFTKKTVTQCAWCKKYRTDKGYEEYKHHLPKEYQISHAVCYGCIKLIRGN